MKYTVVCPYRDNGFPEETTQLVEASSLQEAAQKVIDQNAVQRRHTAAIYAIFEGHHQNLLHGVDMEQFHENLHFD
jgi:hypothetical protein